VRVLGVELAAAQRAAREGASGIAGDDARRHDVVHLVERELRLLELDRHGG
jgi:hypothetical protein